MKDVSEHLGKFNNFFGVKTLLYRYGSGMEKIRIRDGWKMSVPGSEINIPDPYHWNDPDLYL
jgi:hypothetical protein